MKKEIPYGEYFAVLSHFQNQQPNAFVAIIHDPDGPNDGKGIPINLTFAEIENEN